MVEPAAPSNVARDALRQCRLFAGIDDASMDLVAAALRVRRFKRGETIFHTDDPGNALYIIASGHVKITVPGEDGTEPAILTTIGPADYFGELALLDGAPRSATAVAIDEVETQLLRREAFDRLIDSEPALSRTLLAALAAEIRRLTEQVEDLHFLDLPGRLARHLVRLLPPEAGDPPAGRYRMPWPYTQSELAAMIGGSRQSVNRILADLVARGLVLFDGDELVIPDAARLALAAHR